MIVEFAWIFTDFQQGTIDSQKGYPYPLEILLQIHCMISLSIPQVQFLSHV